MTNSWPAPADIQLDLKVSIPSKFTDESELVFRAQHGDLDAFNQLVLAYQDIVFRQACWILNDDEAAADASQEAFILAYRKIDTFRGNSFRPWLVKITTNYCLDRIRAMRNHPTISLELTQGEEDEPEPFWLADTHGTPEQLVEQDETCRWITTAIRKLEPEFRLPLVMIDVEGLNYNEVTEALHVPLGTVKSRLARARSKLRSSLGGLLN